MRDMTAREQSIVEQAAGFVRELFASDCGGHDAGHTFRVYRNALRIAEKEPAADPFLVSLGALLHDADDHKLFQTRDNENARAFMRRAGVPQDRADEVCGIINAVSFSMNRGRKPATQEGKIVQDADRLDAIGAVGIARTFAYGGEHGRDLSDSVQHFYDKLLLLRDEMNTPYARELAENRHILMEQFLEELRGEMDG